MTNSTVASHRETDAPSTRSHQRIFAVLAGLTGVGIVLQGVWAGIFLSSDNRPDSWVRVHDLGAWVTLGLAVLTAAWALLRLRHRRDLLIGAVVLALLVAGEAHLGGMITDGGQDALTAVHVPVALALMALASWLPYRALHTAPAR